MAIVTVTFVPTGRSRYVEAAAAAASRPATGRTLMLAAKGE
jgi:hypothetical protein